MTTEEFSSEFDILYNNIMSNRAPGLDEYEKSVFLTMAQEEIVTSLYSGNNPSGMSFENTEEARRYINDLVKEKNLSLSFIENTSYMDNLKHYKCYISPQENDIWFIIYETVSFSNDFKNCEGFNTALVIPIKHDDYYKIANNPFRGPNNRRVLRLNIGKNLNNEEDVIELVTKYSIKDYTIRYLSRPTPIILEDLSDGLTINNESNKTECSLNPVLHRTILKRAVQLALLSQSINTQGA